MLRFGRATLAEYREALKTSEVDKDERVVLFNCATGLKYPMPDANAALVKDKAVDFGAL